MRKKNLDFCFCRYKTGFISNGIPFFKDLLSRQFEYFIDEIYLHPPKTLKTTNLMDSRPIKKKKETIKQ